MNLRSALLLLLAPLLFVSSRFHELSGLGRNVGDMATDAPTPATPAGFAFLIWILIFALFTIIAGYQARPAQRNNLIMQRIGWPLVVGIVAAHGWMLTAILHGNGLALLAWISLMAAAIFIALARAVASMVTDAASTSFARHYVLPALGLCAGWLTLATFLNLAGTLQITLNLPTGTTAGAIATLSAAILAGGIILFALRHQPYAAVPYAFALLWGLLAVVVANKNALLSPIGVASPPVATTALLGAVVVVGLLACVKKPARAV
ncbi:MAG: hypothetical protein DI585_00910 [Pseudomonas fluorescens]|nr:MAG: hypothetical protein DI585_00910 [Pseudomonas fluorescens]